VPFKVSVASAAPAWGKYVTCMVDTHQCLEVLAASIFRVQDDGSRFYIVFVPEDRNIIFALVCALVLSELNKG
jgi:hypothetical protein